MLTALGALLFTLSFIGINKSNNYKWWLAYRIMIIFLLSVTGLQTLNILIWYSVPFSDMLAYIAAFSTLITLAMSFTVCFSLWKKEKLARLYLYINLPMLLASIVYVGLWFSQQDGEFVIRSYLKLVIFSGMAAQMVLFSVFIGYKIKNAEKEKLSLERDINRKLNEEVDKQTGSLKKAMEEVESQRNELQSLNDLKNKLFTLVAHDLRSPLQNLSSLVELFEKNLLEPDKVVEFTKQIKSGMSESLIIMERLLHWSYKQLDGISINKESNDLTKLMVDVKNELQPLWSEKGIEITISVEKNEILFDRDMLRVIIRNLLSNSIKFSHEKGEIRVSAYMSDSYVCVSIRDYGVGMNPVWYENLVKTGKPEVKSGTKGEKGSGFGLLITKDFVEMNGGELICKSTIGEGTEFIFKVSSTP